MKQGDFTNLAKNYAKYRSGYSEQVARALFSYVGADRPNFAVVDVGAGTGIWSRIMLEAQLHCTCVEPNDAMRAEGEQYTKSFDVEWKQGSGEKIPLSDSSVDWVTMASSFHWVDPEKGLKEFRRVLKPGGYFTALWNPRNIENNELHEGIEATIYQIVPELERKSSGSKKHIADMPALLISSGHFETPIFMEAAEDVVVSKERYLGAWRSVNDIQAQAGPQRFERVIKAIEKHISHLDEIAVPYMTRVWTAKVRSKE
jgi:ubiquinone/menaquinone biosynthesis C-methylase UbiE